MRYKILAFIGFLQLPHVATSQELWSLQEAEQLFLNQNIEIQEGKAELYVAESAIQQAKLFNNPELTLEQVNLWSTQSQRDGESTVIPPVIGSVGKNTQFSIGIEQEIRLGGKRKKGVQLARLNHRLTSLKQAYSSEEALLHFRSLLFEKDYYKAYQLTLREELDLLHQVSQTYEKQRELGFISTSDLLRIQAAEYVVEQEYMEANQAWSQLNELIHSLLGRSITEQIEIDYSSIRFELPDILEQHELHHPLLQMGQEEIQLKRKSLALEKAQKIPDIRLSGNYDRHGGVWPNFIGFGIRFTLPIWNRNQGNIKAAQTLLDLEQSKLDAQRIALQNKIHTELNTYNQLVAFREKITQDFTDESLKQIQQSYLKNLLQKNISLIEFLDFTDTYKERQKILLETDRKLHTQYFTLRYTLGHKTTHYEN